jgi:gliding motility-associated protein GldM
MRREVQLVHEYLADEGALSTGIDRLGYQALLVNQVAEEKFILLSSSFNHSLIKKRMIMMTKSKFNQGTKLKILAIIPLSIILFLGIGCVNGQRSGDENVVAAISPTRMNVMYIGVDNPVRIAVSGYKTSEIEVSVPENGKITGTNGDYVVRPEKPGNLFIEVLHKSKLIQKTEFRVKIVPDPVAAVVIGSKAILNGEISKKDLLKAGGIVAYMRNFDFDLNFEVESFVLSVTVPNSTTVREEISQSKKFSPAQVALIESLIKNQKLIIEDIVVVGPDGVKRKLSPIVLSISD